MKELHAMNTTLFPGGDLSLELTQTQGVTACYITASCPQGFDPDCAIVLRPTLASTALPFTAIHNHSRYWCRPVFGTDLTQLPEKLVQMLLVQDGSTWRCYLPVCDHTFKTVIRGCETGFEFYSYANCALTDCSRQLAFVAAEGTEPFDVIGRCTHAAASLLSIPLRSQRPMPEVFEYLGWCSWDALQIRVNHQGLLDKAQELKEKHVPVGFAIIDDMWADVPELNTIPEDIDFWDMVKIMHRSKLRSFAGDPVRFPKGMAAAISDLKAAGIPRVGVWFPVTGYWMGFTNDTPETQLLPYLAPSAEGRLTVSPTLENTRGFYNLLCSRIREWGGDFVKIDCQGFHSNFRTQHPIGQSASAVQTALDAASEKHFDGALINCMGMPAECMFHRPFSAVSRCSDDFIPESREWFSKNILQCAYNGLLQGQFYINDWDMWWTDDAQAQKNSLCRAISGGPIYISDKQGRTRPEVLKPLMFRDGRILRCDRSATPTADCLIGDPTVTNRIFKLRNRIGDAGMIAAFNISADNRPVSGTVSPLDAGLPQGEYLCYEHFSGQCSRLQPGQALDVTLEGNDTFCLYSLVPVSPTGITLLGRTDKFMGLRAITSREGSTVTLYEGGPFGFISDRDVQVFTQSGSLPVQRIGAVCIVCPAPNETVLTFR